MEKTKKFSHSVKVFIRNQKAQIRRGTPGGVILDVKKQEEVIQEMYSKIKLTKLT